MCLGLVFGGLVELHNPDWLVIVFVSFAGARTEITSRDGPTVCDMKSLLTIYSEDERSSVVFLAR